MNLTRERRDEVMAKAQAIVDAAKAAGRGLTSAERTSFDGHLAEAKSINAALSGDAKSREVLAGLDGMARGATAKARSSIDDGRRLAFGAKMAATVAADLRGGPDGSKALAPSGSAVVGLDFQADPIALGRAATTLLDLLPVIQHDSPVFAYLRQTMAGRTNAAAIVAEGAVKPTSVLSVEQINANLAVVAHLSELVPRYWLLDNTALAAFLEAELQYGLALAIEQKVISDINGTSGIQTQAFSASILQTLRKGLTKIEGAGLVAGSIVLHPTAWETVELALSSVNAVEHMSLPYDPATRRLFGVPVAVTISQAAAVAHVLATDAVALDTDTFGVQVDYSENSTADSFSRNQIQARCETRVATSVYRPMGVVKAALV